MNTSQLPDSLQKLSAEDCGVCHTEFYEEWRTTIHSRAWTEPYFQVDWKFEGSQQICRNCHTPLDRQQPQLVLGFRDKDKWKPVTEPNPAFDSKLQHEGVTCAACHLYEGKIFGVFGDTDAPHPVQTLDNPDQTCVRCHVVEGDRWDTFFRFPPCGTVAEIQSTSAPAGLTGELTVHDTTELGCVLCHMPAVERPLVPDGEVRTVRQHLWRGGHDPEMVKKAFRAKLAEVLPTDGGKRIFSFTLVNTGAAHYLPTGTPDRHLTVQLRVLDEQGEVIKAQSHILKRSVMWRPFIVDLRDTRLPRWQPRTYTLEFPTSGKRKPALVEAEVRYHLLAESRRKRINYNNREPIDYPVFKQRILLTTNNGGEHGL